MSNQKPRGLILSIEDLLESMWRCAFDSCKFCPAEYVPGTRTCSAILDMTMCTDTIHVDTVKHERMVNLTRNELEYLAVNSNIDPLATDLWLVSKGLADAESFLIHKLGNRFILKPGGQHE